MYSSTKKESHPVRELINASPIAGPDVEIGPRLLAIYEFAPGEGR